MAFERVTAAVFNEIMATSGSDRLRREIARYDNIVREDDCSVHRGALSLSAPFPLPALNTLVVGDLWADGLLDLGDPYVEGGSFVVLGNVACSAFANADGKCAIIDGNLEADNIILNTFEDSMLTVIGNLRTHFYYGRDIWAEVGGVAEMEYGDGYCLPIGYAAAAAEAILPRHDRETSLRRLNLLRRDYDAPDRLLELLRNGRAIFKPLGA